MTTETKILRVHELVKQLNHYRDEYYNKNAPTITDAAYDRLFDELVDLEKETGCILSSSPTQTVGFTVVSNLAKVTHAVPLLSLEKTKQIADLLKFKGEHAVMLMLKLDGLTVKLTYENGKLVAASTRGVGDVGEDVTHNIAAFKNVPLKIPYKNKLVLTGEAFIYKSDFEVLKETLLDSNGEPYKNARNLASGSVRSLDATSCNERQVHFLPFSVLEGLGEDAFNAEYKSWKLYSLQAFGFGICRFIYIDEATTEAQLEEWINTLKEYAEKNSIPIDGMVLTYDNIPYSKSCGRTGHHYKDGIAFKFEDDTFETTLTHIEWNPTRFGEIAPVAVFEPVEIDGCTVSRASLHNMTFIKELELNVGNRILVSKRNMIIPHVEDNLDRGSVADGFPAVCPCCGSLTKVKVSEDKKRPVETLWCDNPACETQWLSQMVHFVSKKAMDIEGLSEATLEKFIAKGWLTSFGDLYRLSDHKDEIIAMDGFGKKSYEKLWSAIEKSRTTTFVKFLVAVDIPMIGRTASRTLAGKFGNELEALEAAVAEGFDFTALPDFGETLNNNIYDWFLEESNLTVWKELKNIMTFEKLNVEKAISEASDNPFMGKTVVATGKLEHFSRDSINEKIMSLGTKPGSGVSKNTDYLICGDKAGSKLTKAKELGVAVLTEQEFLEMIGE